MRRQRELFSPTLETRQYRRWMKRHLQERQQRLQTVCEPGLLSILTAVWNGSPLRYFQQLANSLIVQNKAGHSEWVILDNGCVRPELLRYLEELRERSWIRIYRSEINLGVTGGLRFCLQKASSRYILPVDADDFLYPDALRIVTFFIKQNGYPALLYTDEDKIAAGGVTQPYFKPVWDPVLLANSAYIAHLGVVDRKRALELDAYSDGETEGSPDWDLFIRFANAGHTAVHIPEVVYSWRVHIQSTADDDAAKPYIFSSQRAVLTRFLQAQADRGSFSLQNSELLPGAAHWHLVRQHTDPKAMLGVILGDATAGKTRPVLAGEYPSIRFICVNPRSKLCELEPLLSTMLQGEDYICFINESVQIQNPDWPWEAWGLFELFPDTVMIGGRISNGVGIILEADRHFGFEGLCGCPNRGRSVSDPGYFAQMWKQRSVSAVSLQFAVANAQYLLKILRQVPAEASLSFGGPWIGAEAIRDKRRIIYTPFLSGVTKSDIEQPIDENERTAFLQTNADLLPDRRYYPEPFSLQKGFALEK
ncbi:MAG: glycosyltransferase [Acidobacteriaceae bacterium]|nr:glycosyltransferase [Acidobacteriaceae bacterium]